ncbi:OpgC family protein [Acuticoccus sp.]|uniref:OpgC family protein n=1 Tax=Acuticoccus sp. TaxID=1904378 RepID=UPI003B516E9F
MTGGQGARRPRDPRLDVFRGLAMFIIFVAHVPFNPWNNWIPAAFGPSDATELFVFCSGMASALAFGALFRDRSFALGLARTAQRVWQVYWAHITLFLVCVAMLALFDELRGETFYTIRLYTRPFFEDTAPHLIGLMTLRYVPNYFDILPMYLVILAMMPFVAFVGLRSRWAAFALLGAVWLLAQFGLLAFGAEVRVGNEREWFFNPFGWQLIFFVGFSFMMGWIKPPPRSMRLAAVALAIVALGLLFGSRFGWNTFDFVDDVRSAAPWLFWKTDLGIFRVVHFLALAYLCWLAVGERGRRLSGSGPAGKAVDVVRKVGQQSLAVFVSSMVLAQAMGAALDYTPERGPVAVAAANLSGFAILIGLAYVVAWFKAQPWRREAPVERVVAERRQAEARHAEGAIA